MEFQVPPRRNCGEPENHGPELGAPNEFEGASCSMTLNLMCTYNMKTYVTEKRNADIFQPSRQTPTQSQRYLLDDVM